MKSHSIKDECFMGGGEVTDDSERLTAHTGVVSGGETHSKEPRVLAEQAR